MLKTCLDTTRIVSLPDLKHAWKITSEDTVVVDDVVFVRLNSRSSSLSSMLGNVGGHLCLTRSEGLQALMELRNKQSERTDGGYTLFDEQ